MSDFNNLWDEYESIEKSFDNALCIVFQITDIEL